MPERKSGPVKPPVIEASPRSETKAAGADKPADTPATASKARRPLPPLALAVGCVLAGALLGTALTGGLLKAGLLPVESNAATLAALDEQVERQEALLAELDGRITAIGDELAGKAAGADLDALSRQVAALPSATGGDNGQLGSELAALKERVDGLAAGTSGADLSALTQRLDALAATLERQKQDSQAALAELETRIDAAGAADDAARLPLLLVQLADQFAAGTPFAATLEAVRSLKPGLDVPAALTDKASTGLVPAAQLQADFEATLPAMLAAAPAAPDAGWQGAAIDWLQGQLALRAFPGAPWNPTQALVARLEAAMARRNYRQADELLAALPAQMRMAAGDVAEAIAAHAAAQDLVAGLTSDTLAPAAGAAP